MFSTKNFVLEGSDVPSTWIFEYYLNLSEPLTGQDVKIKSIFNPSERTPSFCIYVDKTIMQYKFKDFSTGKNGNKVDLVKLLFEIEYAEAMQKIVADYNKYVKTPEYKTQDIKPEPKWKVDFVKVKGWSIVDQKYWLSYRIGKTMLEQYNVKPVDYFNLIKTKGSNVQSLRVGNSMCFGYFDKEGKPFKFYQPRSKTHKFFKVKNYLQGLDQLKYNKPYLIICSSLKDAMCLKGMGYNIEVIAPDSENTMIKPHIIEYLKKKYKKIITLFDNDQAGRQAIDRYAKAYNIQGCALTICKDISDAMKTHGFDKVHAMLRPLLKETLKK